MKKLFILGIGMLICGALQAQRTVLTPQKGICTEPQVSMVIDSVGTDFFTVSFTPNANCAYYDYLAMDTASISMWTQMMGMTVEQLISLWGIHAAGDTTYTWTEQSPNMVYSVFVLPFGSDSVSAAYDSVLLTTGVLGGTGTSAIAVTVTDISDTSALVTCTPNDQTALFYDGLITVEYYNQLGQDSVVNLFSQGNPYYVTDSWLWTTLQPSTNYYVFARGKNANQEWGDVTLYPFTTNASVGIQETDKPQISVFPIPNDGNFMIHKDGEEKAVLQILTLNGQLCSQYDFTQSTMAVHTELAAGVYVLQVINAQGTSLWQRKMVVR